MSRAALFAKKQTDCRIGVRPPNSVKTKYIPLLFLALLCNLRANIVEGVGVLSTNYNYTAGGGDYVKTGSDSATDPLGEGLSFNIDLGGETGLTTFNGSLSGTLTGYVSFDERINSTTLEQTYARIVSTQSSDVEISGSGTFLMALVGSGVFNSTAPGNSMTYPFLVTGTSVTGDIRVSISTLKDNGGLSKLRLQRMVGGIWNTEKTYVSTARTNFYRETITLVPGEWRFLSEVPITAAFATETQPGGMADDSIDFTFTVGTLPGDVALPAEGDFTHPSIYNEYTDSPKLTLVSPGIVSETPLGGGFTEIEYTSNLANASLCPWTRVTLRVREGVPGAASVENLSFSVTFLDVPATSTVAPPDSLRVKVADAEIAAVRAGILDGSLLTTTGKELLVFRYPVGYIASGSDLNNGEISLGVTAPPFVSEPTGFQTDEGVDLSFYISGPDPMVPGGGPYVETPLLFLEWEPSFAVPPRKTTPVGTNLILWRQNFDSQLPMWVTGASVEQGTLPAPRYRSTLTGDTLSYFEILKHGSVRHVIANPLGAYTSSATEGSQIDTQDLFPVPLPIHINRIKLGDIAFLSGNVNFVPGDFSVRTVMENGVPKEFLVDLSYTAEVNMLLETANHEEVGGSPVVDEEKTIFEAPLFAVTLPGDIVFKPDLKIDVGAVADATRSLSIPFTSKFTIDVTVGVKDGNPYYENRSSVLPIELSDPGVFEAIGATASVFVDTEIAAKFYFAGSSIGVGPTVGARFEADFALTPFANPWWSTTANLDLTAGVELDFAEFLSIVDAEHTLQTYPLFAANAGGPLVGGGGPGTPGNPGFRPLSDPNARWSRSILTDNAFAPDKQFLIPLTGSTDFLAGQASSSSSHIHRVAADGTLLATVKPDGPTFRPVDATPSASGGAYLLGGNSAQLQVVTLDASLATVGTMAFPMSGSYTSLRMLSTATDHFVLGKDFAGGKQKIVLSRLSHAGALVWSRLYDLPENPTFTAGDFLIASDGNLVFCASTTADFTEADGLGPNGLLVNVSDNGFAAKVDAATGDPIWSTLIPHDQVTRYNAIAESPTGEFTIGGVQVRGFVEKEPSMLLVQLTAEGSPIEALFIGHSGAPKSLPNPDADALFVDLPHGGETSYDEIHDLVWTDKGLWACGEMGIFNIGSVLNTGSSAFTLFFDPKLNPGRYAIHGGLGRDGLKRMLVTPDGPLCLGASKSFHPWPQGAADEEAATPWASWLLKLPWEGRIDFHNLSSASQPSAATTPLAGSFFVYPRVMSAQLTGGFDINQPSEDSYGRSDARIIGVSRTLTASTISATASSLTTAFIPAGIAEIKALEYIPPSLVTDQASYLAWHQLNGDEDSDGDGLDTAAEFFLGTNPLLRGTFPLTFELLPAEPAPGPGRRARFTLPRAKLAGAELPDIYDSDLTTGWFLRQDVTVNVSPLNTTQDLLEMLLPAPEDSRFYQVEPPGN